VDGSEGEKPSENKEVKMNPLRGLEVRGGGVAEENQNENAIANGEEALRGIDQGKILRTDAGRHTRD